MFMFFIQLSSMMCTRNKLTEQKFLSTLSETTKIQLSSFIISPEDYAAHKSLNILKDGCNAVPPEGICSRVSSYL